MIFYLLVLSSTLPAQIRTSSALPDGVTKHGEDGYSLDIASINIDGDHVEEGRRHVRTFSVEAKHEKLPDESGVRFNVEDVPPALETHLQKEAVDTYKILNNIKTES